MINPKENNKIIIYWCKLKNPYRTWTRKREGRGRSSAIRRSSNLFLKRIVQHTYRKCWQCSNFPVLHRSLSRNPTCHSLNFHIRDTTFTIIQVRAVSPQRQSSSTSTEWTATPEISATSTIPSRNTSQRWMSMPAIRWTLENQKGPSEDLSPLWMTQ